ncbi:MAG: hypothetical protein ABSD41_05880 [Candidatus Bathyarchaeia archaeon]
MGRQTARICRFSKILNAPLWFVYSWCTDFREDDHKITGSKSRRLIIEKTKRRAVYVTKQKGSKRLTSVGIVTLHPPDRWHFCSIGGQIIETGKYHLKKIGPRETKLEAVFTLKRNATMASKMEFIKHLNEFWKKYDVALEKDYIAKLG